MSNPFIINEMMHNDWQVSWPTFPNMTDADTNLKLLDVVFGQMNCATIGLSILLHGGDTDILWLDYNLWAQKSKKEYLEYLNDMYDIRGVVFDKQSEAEQFKDILEKRYIWQILKE